MYEDAIAKIRAACGGSIPRRAALHEGRIVELYEAPRGTQELEAVSAAFDVIRGVAGESRCPRCTIHLIEEAISTNRTDFWESAAMDVEVEKFDATAAGDSLDGVLASALANCLISSTSVVHALYVSRIAAIVIPRAKRDVIATFGHAVCSNMSQLVSKMGHLLLSTGRQQRDVVLDSIGLAISVSGASKRMLNDMMVEIINQGAYDFVRIFLATNLGEFIVQDTFLKLVKFATSASHVRRSPALAVVAKCIAQKPSLIHGHEDDLSRLAKVSLASERDVRSLAAACLVVREMSDGDSNIKLVADIAVRACTEIASRYED
jgi:hypothetical protein